MIILRYKFKASVQVLKSYTNNYCTSAVRNYKWLSFPIHKLCRWLCQKPKTIRFTIYCNFRHNVMCSFAVDVFHFKCNMRVLLCSKLNRRNGSVSAIWFISHMHCDICTALTFGLITILSCACQFKIRSKRKKERQSFQHR